MQPRLVTRAQRDGKYGYAVTYPSPDDGEFTLFWTREQIDFRGASRGTYRKGTLAFESGRVHAGPPGGADQRCEPQGGSHAPSWAQASDKEKITIRACGPERTARERARRRSTRAVQG